jgi:predicted dehydrogenase
MSNLRIAVVGAGGIAQGYHLPSLQRLREQGAPIELAGLCDLDLERARRLAADFGFARIFGDYRAMLDALSPDAVWVLVPISAMREVAGFFLEQGVPTLMEKPPGASSEETAALADIAAAQGTPHQVAFNRRYAPLLLRMKELLDEAGPMRGLSCQFYRYQRGEPDFAYGTGLHGLDALRFLGDSEVCEVHTRPGPHESAQVSLVYETGVQGIMEMLPRVGMQSERYTAHAGERTVIVDGVIGWLTLFPGFLQCFEGGKLSQTIDNAEEAATTSECASPQVAGGYYGESAAFIRCLREGRTPAPDLASSLRSVQIAEAVNQGRSLIFA